MFMAQTDQQLLPNLESLLFEEGRDAFGFAWDEVEEDEYKRYVSPEPLFECLTQRWGTRGQSVDISQVLLRSVILDVEEPYPLSDEQKAMMRFWREQGYRLVIAQYEE